jgi:hypothetical protein
VVRRLEAMVRRGVHVAETRLAGEMAGLRRELQEAKRRASQLETMLDDLKHVRVTIDRIPASYRQQFALRVVLDHHEEMFWGWEGRRQGSYRDMDNVGGYCRMMAHDVERRVFNALLEHMQKEVSGGR